MSANFKTCMFGGFDKTDVVTYIEKSAKAAQDQIDGLTKEAEEYKKKNEELSSLLESLQAEAEKGREAKEQAEMLQQALQEMQTRAENAEREAEQLRQPAQEYLQMKEHIADIEINAHKRTEEFRAKAMEQLHQIIGQQKQWCNDQRCAYGAMNDEFLQRIREVEQKVLEADYSAFDRMQELLQQMENELDH